MTVEDEKGNRMQAMIGEDGVVVGGVKLTGAEFIKYGYHIIDFDFTEEMDLIRLGLAGSVRKDLTA